MKLIQKVVFVDGITRSGKSMVAPMFRSSDLFDPLIFSYDLEYVMAGLISEQVNLDFARSFFIKVINERIYDAALGRNFNFRKGEISSVDKMLNYHTLVSRLNELDGDEVLRAISHREMLTPFFTHDMGVYLSEFLKLNLDGQVLEVLRNPFEITFSWIQKGWGERQILDPRSFKHTLTHGNNLIPWQAKDFPLEWTTSSHADRCALIVIDLSNKLLNQLLTNHQPSILPVFYEDFATKTQLEVNRIAEFLNVNPNSFDLSCLVTEKLPRIIDPNELEVKRENLRTKLSPSVFDKLKDVEWAYKDFRNMFLETGKRCG